MGPRKRRWNAPLWSFWCQCEKERERHPEKVGSGKPQARAVGAPTSAGQIHLEGVDIGVHANQRGKWGVVGGKPEFPTTSTSKSEIGSLTADGVGTSANSFSLMVELGGSTTSSITGTYASSSNGRGTEPATGKPTLVFWMIRDGFAVCITTDANPVPLDF